MIPYLNTGVCLHINLCLQAQIYVYINVIDIIKMSIYEKYTFRQKSKC